MPDCICDVKTLKRSPAQNKQIVVKAEERIKLSVSNLKNGTPSKNGLSFLCHIAGLLGQRLWFWEKTQKYSDKVHIDINTCIKCGQCVAICPIKNLSLSQNEMKASGHCTLCYRCVNQCTSKAITILGTQVVSHILFMTFNRTRGIEVVYCNKNNGFYVQYVILKPD